MDAVDRKIVQVLGNNARISLKQLALHVKLSAPTVADRMRRLEDRGCITGYAAIVPPQAIGYGVQAIVRINPLPGALKEVEQIIQNTPQFIECDRVTGEDCFYARLLVRSVDELDDLLEPLHLKAGTNTAIVKSQSVKRRLPPLL